LQDPRRDRWQCYSGAYTRLGAIGLLERPFVNHMARALERCLDEHAAARATTLERRPRWKGAARFAVALTHDVDDVTLRSFRRAWRLLRQARSPRGYALRAGLKDLARAATRPLRAPDPYWAFERWMAEEERCGFRSTFYVCAPSPSWRHEFDPLYSLDDVLEYEGRRITVGELLREMHRRGHEVGLHGSYASQASADELARQRGRIAAAAGIEVGGIRQHFLRFDVGATWEAQSAAGFHYDTTLGYNEAVGFRAGIAAPYRPWDPRTGAECRLWELPLTAMDGALFRTLKLDAVSAAAAISRQLDAVEAVGGLSVLLWHPNAADERSFPGWWASYLRVLDELSRRGAWVASAGEIARWWGERWRAMSTPAA
jgi:peptidoglycan/xylan/chitin deacetylase (PgdA/CDA1 family)